MKRELAVLACVGVALAGSAVACGSADATSRWPSSPDGSAEQPNDTTDGGRGGSPDDAVDGVLLVHASYNRPPVRVCFDDRPSLAPQPDAKLMPQSNLVGLEVGSAVHIPELRGATPASKTTLRIYLESALRFHSAQTTCGSLASDKALVEGKSVWTVPFDGARLFSEVGVYMLAIEGCVGDSSATATKAVCGQGFVNASTPNLRATVIKLATPQRSPGQFFVQGLVVSDAIRSAVPSPTLAFGALGATKPIAADLSKPTPQPETPAALPRPVGDPAVFDRYGFEASVGGAKPLVQSLAETQSLTDPRLLPREFYTFPSNFVLLVLGDPAASPSDVGRTPHVIAVPVRDPEERDAGPVGDAGSTTSRDAATSSEGGK